MFVVPALAGILQVYPPAFRLKAVLQTVKAQGGASCADRRMGTLARRPRNTILGKSAQVTFSSNVADSSGDLGAEEQFICRSPIRPCQISCRHRFQLWLPSIRICHRLLQSPCLSPIRLPFRLSIRYWVQTSLLVWLAPPV